MTGATALAAPRVKVLKLSITNPTDQLRSHENIVVNVADLKRVAPDFKAGEVIVTTSDAATLEEDARTDQTMELPSQADALNAAKKKAETALKFDLSPRKTPIARIPME